MIIPQDLLELLRLQDPSALAGDAGGRFPLGELDEALRSGEGSADLVAWLERWREVYLRDEDREEVPYPAAATHRDAATGTRMDAPPGGDAKNYEQGPG